MRLVSAFVAVALLGATASPLAAAPCKDAKGKFTKCPAAKPSGPCKDAKGKFVKCGTPGAMPMKK